jgi:polysaccharide export outer membrane protein
MFDMKMPFLIWAFLLVSLTGCSAIGQQKKEPKRTTAEDISSIQALNQDFTTGSNRLSADTRGDVSPAQAYAALSNSQGTMISEQDVLDVNVFKVPELSASDLTVETNGAISLPLVGSVVVRGLSIVQAQRKIASLLNNYMQDPKVTVTRKEQAFKRVTVEGAVRTPGVFPIKGRMTFLQAIALSQGITDLANDKAVVVFRNGRQYGVNLDLIRKGQAPDPILQNDDRIVVLKSDSKVLEEKVINYLPALLSPFSLLL